MHLFRLAWLGCVFAAFLALCACGNDGGGGGAGDDDVGDDDTTTPDAAPDQADFVELIGRDWEIVPGEDFRCIRIRVEEDMYISGFRALNPLGTHHTVLTISDSGPAEEYDCDGAALDLEMLFASGVGTDDLSFPEGVAIKVEQGKYLNLNLHLFNTQPNNITGHSGVLIKTIPAAQVQHEAEMVFAGDSSLNIPGYTNGTPHRESGGCTFRQDATLVAYWPHMHQFAVSQRVTLTIDGEARVIHDEEYAFAEQRNLKFDPAIQVSNGDKMLVECFYENDTGDAVHLGESSTDEMCFTGLYRYPKHAIFLFDCVSDG